MNLHILDYLVIAAYFAITIGIGIYCSRKNTDTEEYFLGGRSFPGWAIALSLVGTTMSSVTFIGHPADTFKTTMVRLVPGLAMPLVVLVSAYVFLPFFRKGTISSAYEYLKLRYSPSVSCYAATIFFLLQLIRVASILFLISLVIQSVTGLDYVLCMIVAGGVTALYTGAGGFGAVIWTDVFQTIVLISGAFVIIAIAAYSTDGGFFSLLETAQAGHKLSFAADLNTTTGVVEPLAKGFSLSQRTMTMLFIIGIVQFLSNQFDQTNVQRWCSAKSAKEARKAILILGVIAVPIWYSFKFVGAILWAFFQKMPDPIATEILNGTRKAEEIIPYYIVEYVPAGIAGVLISGALAAAMSSLSSSINSASMVWVNDIYKPYIAKGKSDKHYLRAGFSAAGVISLFMMVGAYWFYVADNKTFNDIGLILISVFGGGLLAVFLVGIFSRLADARAIWLAIIGNACFTGYLLLSTRGIIPEAYSLKIDIYYAALCGNAIALFLAVTIGYFLRPKNDLKNLTVWDQDEKPLV
ncbi:sodium:solute symporter family transporter [Coraliomargarita sp. W4R53]